MTKRIAPTRVKITLVCGHVRWFYPPTPRTGDQVLCTSCDKDTAVLLSPAGKDGEFRWYCSTCGTGRKYGQARLNMQIQGAKHAQKRPGHTVQLWHGFKIAHTINPENSGQMTIDMLETPPF